MYKTLWSASLACILLFSSCTSSVETVSKIVSAPLAIGSKEDPIARFNYERRQLVDPKTNKIPDFVFQKELTFARQLDKVNSKNTNARKTTLEWSLSGPANVGGRTRGLAIDVRDEEIILAGGVSGGVWKSTNGGLSWTRTSQPSIINSVTCLVQDERTDKKDIWYYGTGELRGNSARAVQAPYRGDGIFMSNDNGDSWNVLPSTANNQLTIFESPFNYVWKLAINTVRNDVDELYAAIYGGVVKSQDGGSSWTTILGSDLINDNSGDLNNSNASFYSNIMITPSGKMYAYLSTTTGMGSDYENKGIFFSDDGEVWTNITPNGFQKDTDRLVMAHAPSNENIIYFLIQGGTQQLWKRENDNWSNISSNIPISTDEMEPFDSQDSYNMTIKIHPEDPLIVFLGGTNLYRSMNGFNSPNSTQQIGGYDIENVNDLYENHHPDQHELVFLNDGDEMLSANDGGIFKTFNNRSNATSWFPLNNGYVTSQFYSVAVSKAKDGNGVIGGMQDNGTSLKTSSENNSNWVSVLGGDGSFSATTPNDWLWYASFQQGKIFQMALNEDGGLTNWARVDPEGVEDYLFITPFVLDPNNYNRMYLAGNQTIWRNDNLTQIVDQKQVPTSVNWTKLNVTNKAQVISALDISTIPGHTLYYGSATGSLFKVNDANNFEINVAQVFQHGGYVSSICVDPSNAEKVLFSYSNYNIPSLFYSIDGGITIVDVGGNLEENIDGTGNGPSIRWVEIIPLENGSSLYFASTSTGLYSATELIEHGTVWVKEGNETIGNAVVTMSDYRSIDGKIVVATHGNGVFHATIANTKEIDTSVNVPNELAITPGYPNPFKDVFNIKFTIPNEGPLAIYVFDVSGKRIKTLLNYPQFLGEISASWDGSNDNGNLVQSGVYHYVIFYAGGSYAGKMIYVN
jgi:hypothetical protein